MIISNPTEPGRLKAYLLGDLAVARRHLHRLECNLLAPTPGVLNEIKNSIERCVARIENDITDTPVDNEG